MTVPTLRFERRLPGHSCRPGRALHLLCLLLLATAGQASGQEGEPRSLTLEDALAETLRSNPSLLVARGEDEQARWEHRNARGDLLPYANASSSLSWQGAGEQRFGSITAGQLGFQDQPAYYFSSFNVGVGLDLDGSRLLAPGRARASWDAARARIRTVEDRVRLEVTHAYLEVLRQEEELRLTALELERAEQNHRLADAQQQVGLATLLEVRQAEVGLGRARVNQLRAGAATHQARAELLARMGWDPERAVRLVTDFPLYPVEEELEDLLGRALTHSPGLGALRASREAAARDVSIARTAYLPSLSVQVGWSGFSRRASDVGQLLGQAESQARLRIEQCEWQNELYNRLANPLPAQNCSLLRLTPDQREGIVVENNRFPLDFTRQPPQASLTLSLPIFQGLARQRRVEVARVEADNADHRLREEELAIRRDLSSGLTWARAAYETAVLESQNRDVADQQLQLARDEFSVGTVDFLQLLDAETVKARADREWLAAVFAFHETMASLEAVVGSPLRPTPRSDR